MYKNDFCIVDDKKGDMAMSTPDPSYVADIVCGLLDNALKFEKIYDIFNSDYDSDFGFFAMLGDAADVLDQISEEELTAISEAYGIGTIYSECGRWIMPALYGLAKDSDGRECLFHVISDIIEECEQVDSVRMQTIISELYGCLAALFTEIYNTYDLGKWINYKLHKVEFSRDVTRGFNEVLIRKNMSIDEMADMIYEKTQKFIFVSNEVDRDPEVSKKVRSLVPDDLKEDFESVIELLTAEDVEDILNGRKEINRTFINKISLDESDDQDDGEDEDEVKLKSVEGLRIR